MDLRSKFRGAMLGTGIGDALGRSLEGGGMLRPEAVVELVEKQDSLRYTDDTQQMIALAESIVKEGGFDGKTFAERLVENFDPSRGYGPGSVQVIRSIENGGSWDEPARRLFGGSGSYGNGSSMRVAPIGLLCHNDLENLAPIADDSSRVTHIHRLGRAGAVFQASSVALATRRDPSESLDSYNFLERLREFTQEREYLEKLNEVQRLLDSKVDRSEVVQSLGNGVEAFNSVPTATYSFLSHSNSFEDAVKYTISLGGDADTIGAMTGAIAGAFHGSDKIPAEWKEKLEDRGRIEDLADEFFEVSS